MKDFKFFLLINYFKYNIINHNKAPKFKFENLMSTKSNLFSFNKNVKFLDLKSIYLNEAPHVFQLFLNTTTYPQNCPHLQS